MRTNSGADFQSIVMGGDLSGEVGTATATSATTITTASTVSHTANDLAGHRVVAVGATSLLEGVILSNTGGTNTQLTIDQWVAPGSSTVASTPSSTCQYAILNGGVPARVIALSTDTVAPAADDTTLASELNNSGGGLNRAAATYSHTLGATSYTLTHTFTANSSDGSSNTIEKIGVFNSVKPGVGIMVFETALTSPPTIVSGDTLTVTETVNI